MNQKKFISLLSLVIFKVCFYNISFFSYADEQKESSSVYAGPYEGVMTFYTGGDAFFPLYTKPNRYLLINEGDYSSTVEFGGFVDGERGEFGNEGLFYLKRGTFIPLSHVKYIAFKLGNTPTLEERFIPVPLFSSNDYFVSLNWKYTLNEKGRIILKFEVTGISSKRLEMTSEGSRKTNYDIQGTIEADKLQIKYQSEHLSIGGAGDRKSGFGRKKCTQVFFKGKKATLTLNRFLIRRSIDRED